jgi:hypothetical protein
MDDSPRTSRDSSRTSSSIQRDTFDLEHFLTNFSLAKKAYSITSHNPELAHLLYDFYEKNGKGREFLEFVSIDEVQNAGTFQF